MLLEPRLRALWPSDMRSRRSRLSTWVAYAHQQLLRTEVHDNCGSVSSSFPFEGYNRLDNKAQVANQQIAFGNALASSFCTIRIANNVGTYPLRRAALHPTCSYGTEVTCVCRQVGCEAMFLWCVDRLWITEDSRMLCRSTSKLSC
jgi:hypothetical protein